MKTMVREAVLSAATLAGLVGLACLYNGASNLPSNRIARGADLVDIVDLQNDDEQGDMDFMNDFGFGADDMSMFQSEQGAKAGAIRKQISQVKTCLKNPRCTARANDAIAGWSDNANQYITANPSRLLKPIVVDVDEGTEEEPIQNNYGLCTPGEDGVPCEEQEDSLFHYKAHNNEDPKNVYSVNSEVQGLVDDLGESTAFQAALESMKVDTPRGAANVFARRALKMFLIIPNGVPVHMPEAYNFRYGNYWRWFKKFNEKYMGVAGKTNVNRVNMHFWFLRQDKNLKVIMRNPAKSSSRFPWKRFDAIMLPVGNTAAQPKLAATYQALWETIDLKGMGSEFTEGQDCFTIWFHQYIPQDVLDISDSLFQEEYMNNVEGKCTVIHVWMGAQKLAGDKNTVKVIQYLQGLLQPSQLVATSADPQKRRYYFLEDLQTLMGGAGENLMDQIYNDIVMERHRVTCLLASKGNDLGAIFEAANDRYDDYYNYGEQSTTTVFNHYYGYTSQAMSAEYELAYDSATTSEPIGYTTYEGTTEEDLGPPDYKCCGIGFGGKKYDTKTGACCDDGSVAATEADCFLL